jgi:outer membrane protein TolC
LKKLLFLIPFFLYASVLSELKQKELNIDKLKSIKESKETKRSWINPVMLQYLYQKDNTLGYQTTTNQLSISINQPIFKSGAIYYSIKYADILKKYNLKNLTLQKRALIKQALDLAFDYKINLINKKILNFQIKNAKIDVKRKKEAFLSGTGDSSLLDNAILNLNNLKLSLQDIISSLVQIKYAFKNLSDLNIEDVKLPHFNIISKRKYLNENLELLTQKEFERIKFYIYKMQLGNQLLTISFNGSYNYKEYKNKKNSDKQNYYIVGLSATLPIDVNAKTRVEKTKLDYLKSQYLLEDKKRELLNTFNMILAQIDSLKKKIKIYKENIKIYDNLIKTTEESIKAGNATPLDLEVLENSKMANILHIKAINLQIQKNLLELYYKLVSFSNR